MASEFKKVMLIDDNEIDLKINSKIISLANQLTWIGNAIIWNHDIRRLRAGGCDSLPETGQIGLARGATQFIELSGPENIEARVFARTSHRELGTEVSRQNSFFGNIQASVAEYPCWTGRDGAVHCIEACAAQPQVVVRNNVAWHLLGDAMRCKQQSCQRSG